MHSSNHCVSHRRVSGRGRSDAGAGEGGAYGGNAQDWLEVHPSGSALGELNSHIAEMCAVVDVAITIPVFAPPFAI